MGSWSLTGNAVGAASAAFLGTTDNNALVIQTGDPSVERLRVDPSGNVGIGIATPSAALHVAPGKALRIEGGTSAADGTDYFSFGGYGSFGIDAPGVVNGRLVVQNSGHVGIGTSAPVSTLHVNGAVTLSPQANIMLGNGAFGSVVGAILREEVSSIRFGLVSRGSELAFYTNTMVTHIPVVSGAPPPPPPPGPTERLRIDCNANVGIGTSAPFRALTVQGEASIVPSAESGTSSYLNVSDATGSNGANYSLSIRGLDDFGAGQVNLASLNLLADSVVLSGNLAIGMSVPLRALTVVGETSIVPNAGNGTSGYLNVSDGAGSNGRSYTLNIRGLDQNGNEQVNLANINLLADNVTASGNVSVAGDVLLTGADCAEEFDTSGTQRPDAGTVMVIDAHGTLRESIDAYDKRVAGVVSGAGDYKPALVLDKKSSSESRVPLALVGKVYCKVDAGYSAIEVGDLLTTSATPGHAMKAAEPQKAFGCVIGKALRAVKQGQSLIPILVALQ